MIYDQFVELYLKKMEQLDNTVSGKTKIYLEMNYWNYMRDCMFGNETDQRYKKIFSLILKGIESGRILCPVSSIVFFETLKQSGTANGWKTVQTLELLSKNVSTVYYDVLPGLTFFLPFSKILGLDLPFSKCPIWTHPYFSLSPKEDIRDQLHPLASFTVQPEQVALSFTEFMWNISITKLFEEISKKPIDSPIFDFAPIYTANSQHKEDFKSFDEVLKKEREGCLNYTSLKQKTHLYIYGDKDIQKKMEIVWRKRI
ncbi:hypothetical protein [uncultured Sphaerochaeta sp.]|uniref:hypothetical protein n=1 Tax=uncultured Sphaerochaeta sp. TaxID=886478 RepID=UPI002A0A2DB5|nr:hypothetical protein [uncultured Sphaerochaeta sp.]